MIPEFIFGYVMGVVKANASDWFYQNILFMNTNSCER
jgi:hypothetical protein